jgi:hypothetical protein
MSYTDNVWYCDVCNYTKYPDEIETCTWCKKDICNDCQEEGKHECVND